MTFITVAVTLLQCNFDFPSPLNNLSSNRALQYSTVLGEGEGQGEGEGEGEESAPPIIYKVTSSSCLENSFQETLERQ